MQRNLWQETAPSFSGSGPLSSAVIADAVIIGGGFTGLSAALHLAEAGASVRLLEAETIGFGGSGRNVGLVNAGLWTPPDKVETLLGKQAGAKLNEILAQGPDLVFSLIRRHNIACEAIRNGTLHCAHSPAGLADLRERLRQQQARGAPVELVDASQTARLTGAKGFLGALLDRRAGTIQPLGYARGLAETAKRAGAFLHEQTPALGITERNGVWTVTTGSGTVTSKALILATNAYPAHLGATLRPAFTPVHYFQCATLPLPPDLLTGLLPERQGCWDTAKMMSSFRLDQAGRLLLGAIGSLDGIGAGFHASWAKRKLAKLFPKLAGIGVSHCWSGRIAMTSDHLPKILWLGPSALSIYGYSGRGIAPGTVFGKAAADFIITEDPETLPLAPIMAHTEQLTALKAFVYETAAIVTHAASTRGL